MSQVIRINATVDNYPPELPKFDDPNGPAEVNLDLTYSAYWSETNVKFEDRRKFYEVKFFKADLEIHWLSIMNSFVLVILLTGFLAIIIMRVLRSDYARYARTEEEVDGMFPPLPLSLSFFIPFYEENWF
jgi:Endomembrane protein 70